MDINRTIQEFLNNQKEERDFNPRSIERYEYLLRVYAEYLIEGNHLDAYSLKEYLNKVTAKDIFNTLSFYISTCSVSSEDTADFYISVLKSFFQFLKRTHLIENDTLISSFGLAIHDPASFVFQYDKYIKNLKQEKIIIYKKSGRPLSENEIKLLIAYCDECIEEYSVEDVLADKNKYNRFVYSIMIKLVIYCGVSERSLSTIKNDDMDMTSNRIKINNTYVLLPFKLRSQVKTYMDLRKTRTQ